MKKRYANIELLRIVSCLAVIMTHMGNFVAPVSGGGYADCYLKNALGFTVPCFVMITGWIWLDENKTFDMVKCLKKVLIPLFTFGYIFALMELVYMEKRVSPPIFINAFGNLLTGKIWGHMWYLYMLVGLYLVMPALKLLLGSINEKQLRYMLAILLVFTVLFPTIKEMTGFEIGFYLPIEQPYFLYLLLGSYLSKRPVPVRYAVVNWAGTHLVLLLFAFLFNSRFSYAHFAVFLISCAYFILAVSIQPACEKINGSALCYIGSKTFGIYIVHMVFINILFKVIKPDMFVLPTGVTWLLLTVVVFFLSFLTTIIIQKIPIINKIFCI